MSCKRCRSWDVARSTVLYLSRSFFLVSIGIAFFAERSKRSRWRSKLVPPARGLSSLHVQRNFDIAWIPVSKLVRKYVISKRKLAAMARNVVWRGLISFLWSWSLWGTGPGPHGRRKAIGRMQAQRLGFHSSEAIHHLAQKLSIPLWRGNSTLWTTAWPAFVLSLNWQHSLKYYTGI